MEGDEHHVRRYQATADSPTPIRRHARKVVFQVSLYFAQQQCALIIRLSLDVF